MTQFSMLPWETDTETGDGAAKYTEEQANNFFRIFDTPNAAKQGVRRRYLNELAVSGTSSPLAVASGAAVCYGRYWSTSSVNLTVTTPSSGDTGGYVVLRASWSANTIRLAVKLNTDGAASLPVLTQTSETTWELPLASFVIDTSGNIWTDGDKDTAGVTDLRVYLNQFTQKVIAPVINAQTGGVAIDTYAFGFLLPDDSQSVAYGLWSVPADWVPGTDIVIKAMVAPGATGNAVLTLEAITDEPNGGSYGPFSTEYSESDTVTLGTANQMALVLPLTLDESVLDVGHFVAMALRRNGQATQDTLADDVGAVGFQITYESAP